MKEESIVSMIEKEANEKYPRKSEKYGVIYIDRLFNKKQQAYIAGRSKGIESEKAKDERIKELEDGLNKAVEVIKVWHNADEVWNIYLNNAPEMKPIRELLKKE